jgi:hypothetical protein
MENPTPTHKRLMSILVYQLVLILIGISLVDSAVVKLFDKIHFYELTAENQVKIDPINS